MGLESFAIDACREEATFKRRIVNQRHRLRGNLPSSRGSTRCAAGQKLKPIARQKRRIRRENLGPELRRQESLKARFYVSGLRTSRQHGEPVGQRPSTARGLKRIELSGGNHQARLLRAPRVTLPAVRTAASSRTTTKLRELGAEIPSVFMTHDSL